MASDRDLQIIAHVARYRLTTRSFIRELFLPAGSDNAANKVVARLVRARWLTDRTSGRGFSYLTLGTQAPLQMAGQPAPRVGSFAEQSLPLAYGLLAYCVRQGFQRITRREFTEAFPELAAVQCQNSHFFVDNSADVYRLSTVLLDRGNAPRDLLRKLNRLAQQRYRLPAFLDLIRCRRFLITIITAEPRKARLLEQAIEQNFRGRTQVKVAVVDELRGFFRRI